VENKLKTSNKNKGKILARLSKGEKKRTRRRKKINEGVGIKEERKNKNITKLKKG
jgi:hypothetical protein